MSGRAGLVGYWTFDADGTATYGPDLTLGGSASVVPGGQVGAGALNLTGAGGDASAAVSGSGYATVSGSAARTVSFWMQAGTQTDASPTLLSWGVGSNTARYDIRLSGNVLRTEVGGSGINGTANITDGLWHHVMVSYAAGGNLGTTQFYIDGVLDGATASTSVINTGTTQPLRVGNGFFDANRNFVGQMDDVRIYDQALTAGSAYALGVGASLDLDASKDATGDSRLDNQSARDATIFAEFLNAGTDTPYVPTLSSHKGIASYAMDGTQRIALNNGTTGVTLNDFADDPTNNSVSFELLFSPSTFTGNQIVFDTGGSAVGMSLALFGDELRMSLNNTTGAPGISLTSLGVQADDWVHAVAVINLEEDLAQLFVNGAANTASTTFTGTDWAGTDGGPGTPGDAFFNSGGFNNTVQGAVGANSGLTGHFGYARMYETAWDDVDVQRLFDGSSTAVPEPNSLALLGFGILALVRRYRG